MELDLIARRLFRSRSAEEVFGDLSGSAEEMLAQAKRRYRRFAGATHPDHYLSEADQALATSAFQALQRLWTETQQKIQAGTYGTESLPSAISTRSRFYEVDRVVAKGDICNLYRCHYTENRMPRLGILKIARDPRDNSLVANEARILRHLESGYEALPALRQYVPQLIETLQYRDSSTKARQANVLRWVEGLYSLEEVHNAYPKGVGSKDMAWIWRGLLLVLGFAHQQGVIHGAVIPTHVLIHPEERRLLLIDWSYAVVAPESSGERIGAISANYGPWYPREIQTGEAILPGFDLYLGAACMIYLVGGEPIRHAIPNSVPRPLRSFLTGCLMEGPGMRPQDAWKLREEFTEVSGSYWGAAKSGPLVLPRR